MQPITHRVDAFAGGKHRGNPAGVYLSEKELPQKELQKIAFKTALPVTSFLRKLPDSTFEIRWFTMNREVNLCGHGTVAAAYWLYTELGIREMQFQSKSGLLTSKITEDGKVEMNFPAQQTRPCDENTKRALEKVLKVPIKACFFGYEDYLVELESSTTVTNYTPDFAEIQKVDCRGIIITAWDEHYGFDCVSRFFCPRVGINEDQVCVSAHCKLVPYWTGKKKVTYLHAWQASRNSGELYLYALKNDRVRILGSAQRQNVVAIA